MTLGIEMALSTHYSRKSFSLYDDSKKTCEVQTSTCTLSHDVQRDGGKRYERGMDPRYETRIASNFQH